MRSVRGSLAIAVLGTLSGTALASDDIIQELLTRSDDLYRGASSTATMTMEVKTARYERSVTMQTWTQGSERSLIRITEPAKDRGVATLKVEDNIWNYLPKADRTVKVPASMMSGSWMGSHITNDDLVQESRLSEDFTYALTRSPELGHDGYTVELVPKPDAPVVWGKIVASYRADRLPLSTTYHDEDGALVRTMTYGDYKEINDRLMPTTFMVIPADKPEEFTRMRYEALEFGVDIPDSTFTKQALGR